MNSGKRYINSIEILTSMLTAFLIFVLPFTMSSCGKLLDENPDKSRSIISTLDDLQALLYNDIRMNNYSEALAVSGTDEYYITSSQYDNARVSSRKIYTWSDDANSLTPWRNSYIVIATSNTILQEMERITEGSVEKRNNIRGQALLFRAFAFYHLAQLYCKPYSMATINDPGIPLKMTGNAEEAVVRSTVGETYDQILRDATEAVELLPDFSTALNLPGKVAVYGFLARTYLAMANYAKASEFASKYLSVSPELMDFNDLDPAANPAILSDNIENRLIIYVDGSPLPSSDYFIDSNLISSYNVNDLRKQVFYQFNSDGTAVFKGSYYGSYWSEVPFYGIATNEIYFIRAECRARLSDIEGGMDDLNTVLEKRWVTDSFPRLSANTKEEAISIIMEEKKKELIFRGIRWSDLRRLNLEGANISLTREIDGVTYTLPANDKRWVWLIPAEVISTTGIQQNER